MKTLALLVALTIPAAAVAGGTPQNSGEGDERLICRSVKETGSRLSSRRVCQTAAQWAEQRRITRQDVERSQVTRVNRDVN